jgi:hypothetical protein
MARKSKPPPALRRSNPVASKHTEAGGLAKKDGIWYDADTVAKILGNAKNVEGNFARIQENPAPYGAIIFVRKVLYHEEYES